MFQPANSPNYPDSHKRERDRVHAWIKEAKAEIADLSEEELEARAKGAHERWHEMFGEKIEPVFDDHHNYDVVRPEPWWHRFF